MKKLLIILFVFSSILAKSQTTSSVTFTFCLYPILPTTVDSVQLTANLDATDGYQSIKWAQVSGPNTAGLGKDSNSFKNTTIQISQQIFKNLVPGTYVFSAVGTSVTGITTTLTDTVIILAAPVPVVNSITIKLFGQTFIIPTGQGTIITVNGATQSY